MPIRRRVWAALATALLMVAGLAWASAAATGSVAGVQADREGAVSTTGRDEAPAIRARDLRAPVPAPAVGRTAQPQPETAPRGDRDTARTSPPARLSIPAIGVDAPVAGVGVADDGGMAVIDDIERVGWYEHGPVPGAAGSSVLAAHVDTEEGRGVFFDLVELAVGDAVEVEDADGTRQRFEVSAVERHHKDALPVEELFARDGPERLTLITCGGPFDPEQRSYRDNVVVTAMPA